MELEIMQLPCSYLEEFDFNSGRTSPCGSSPSTPRGFGDQFYFSAPTSPTPPLPPPTSIIHGGVGSYEYEDLGRSNYIRGLYATNTTSKTLLDAEKNSEEGDNIMIKPKKPLPNGVKHKSETIKSPLLSPELESPNSTKFQHKKKFWSPFSPTRKKEQTQNDETSKATRTKHQGRHRDREIGVRHVTRSLSPLRVSKYPWEEDEQQNWTQLDSTQLNSISKPPLPTLSLSSSSKGSKKWRLKDLLLFRSASEGRALDYKDPLKKQYSYLQWKHEVHKNSNSDKNNINDDNNMVGPRNRRGPISAHELHYTVNKAISEDMKKKSFLPYKQGILGRLAFNPTVHALAHGFGSLAPT